MSSKLKRIFGVGGFHKGKNGNQNTKETPAKTTFQEDGGGDEVMSPAASVRTAATTDIQTPDSFAMSTTRTTTTTPRNRKMMMKKQKKEYNDIGDDDEEDEDDDNSNNSANSHGSEQPWDVQLSRSEDAQSTGGKSNTSGGNSSSVHSHSVPTPTMKRKIQERLQKIKAHEDVDEIELGMEVDHDDDYDDDAEEGNPTTTISNSTKRMLSLGRRSVRPLNPPAEAGMGNSNSMPITAKTRSQAADDEELRESPEDEGRISMNPMHRNLTDDDDEDDEDVEDADKNDGGSDVEDDNDDMPMDELQEYQTEQNALTLCGATTVDYDEDDADGGGGVMGGANICNYTLTALNDICGIQQRSHRNDGLVGHDDDDYDDDADGSPRSPRSSSSKSPRNHNTSSSSSSSSKTAAARALMLGSLPRLKPPYGVEEQTAIEVEYIEPERRQDAKSDVSSGTGGAGANPRKKNLLVQAMARRAKQDFEAQRGRPAHVSSPISPHDNGGGGGGGDDENASSSTPPPPDNVYSSFTSSEKRKFLTLINNGLSPTDATAQVLKERKEAQEELEASSGGGVGGGDNDSASKSSAGKGLRFWRLGGGVGIGGKKDHAVPTEVRSRRDVVESSLNRKKNAAAIANDGDQDEEERFARSGISYYDAVRKQENVDDEGEEDDDEQPLPGSPSATAAVTPSKNKRRSRLPKFGFGRLGGSKGKPVGDEDEDNIRMDNDNDDDDDDDAIDIRDLDEDAPLSPRQQQQQQQQLHSLPSTTTTTTTSPGSRPRKDPPPLTTLSSQSETNASASDSVAAPSVPTDMEVLEDLEAAAEASRSVFKPIPSPASPPTTSTISSQKGVDPAGSVAMAEEEEEGIPALQASDSGDSILDSEGEDDEDGDHVYEDGQDQQQTGDYDEEEQDIVVVPAAPEDRQADSTEEEKEEITSQPQPQDQQRRFVDNNDDDDEEEDIASKILGASSTLQMPLSPARATKNNRQGGAVVVDVDSKVLNSTEMINDYNRNKKNAGGASIPGGDRSVKTHATYATMNTNYTTSTRSRRPGAAKQRLTSQKTGETARTAQKYMGWQESIQAAAAGIGKVWDPVKGWVDYKDMEDEKKSEDDLEIPGMPPVQPASVTRARGMKAAAAVTPEPIMEEQAPPPATREPAAAVMKEQAPAPAPPAVVAHPHMARAPHSPHRHGAVVARKDAKSPARSRGWVETMKEATARIESTNGQRWDPELGWIGPNGEPINGPSRYYQGGGYDGVDGQVLDSDTQDFGTIVVPVADQSGRTPSEQQPQQQYQLKALPPPSQEPQYRRRVVPQSQEPQQQQPRAVSPLLQEPQHQLKSLPPSQEPEYQQEQRAVAPSQDPQYQQQQQARLPPSQEPQYREQKALPPSNHSRQAHDPSGQTPVNFVRRDPNGQSPQHEDDLHSTDAISMKSGDVSATASAAKPGRYIQLGDTGSVSSYYFGKPSGKAPPNKDNSRGTKLSSTPEQEDTNAERTSPTGSESQLVNVRKEKVSPADASMFPEIPKGSGRRSSGPVDVDEIDDMDNGSFGAAPDFSWDEDNFDASTGPNHSAGKSGSKAISSGRSEISQGSVSTASKVPKLKAPKRDTSPIRGGRGSQGKSRSSPRTSQLPSQQSRGRANPSQPHNGRSPATVDTQQGRNKSPLRPILSEKSRAPAPTTPRASPPGSGPGRALNPNEASPGPSQDARSTHTADSSPSVSSVKDLHDYWERRANKEGITPPSAEWKTFLSKKVRDESNAAPNQQSRGMDDERDSLFDFGSESAFPRQRKSNALGAVSRNDDVGLRSLEEISNLSPIQNVHDDDDDEDDDDEAPSEVSTNVAQGTTFLQRLQACAAPMMPSQGANCNAMPSMPMAHLAFMRSNPNAAGSPKEGGGRPSSKFAPPNLCAKPDVIVEEDEDRSGVEMQDMDAEQNDDSHSSGSRSRSNPRSGQKSGDMSSVISAEQFGQKNAYLEAIAMKAAVSGSKKNRRSRPGGSDAGGPPDSSSSEKHSDSWQRFLDKKTASRSEDQEDVSRAAEKYATEKVNRMMENMAVARSRSGEFQPRSAEEATGAFPSVGNATSSRIKKGNDHFQFKNESTRAAEDLAAARVQAMMHVLSSPRTLDEGEGEI